MNPSIERRLKALEARDTQPWRFVFRYDHETEEQAKKRAGVKPDEPIIFMSAEDRDL